MSQQWVVISNLPAIQRDLFLSRAARRTEDKPVALATMEVVWKDTVVRFGSDEAVCTAEVWVTPDINLSVFTRRPESLLDCGLSDIGEWVLKFNTTLTRYGGFEQARRLLCDKIATVNPETEETIGVLKLRRRAINAGHAKVRLVPSDDAMDVIVRHTTAQGLKAVWKSIFWRLDPQIRPSKEIKEPSGRHPAADEYDEYHDEDDDEEEKAPAIPRMFDVEVEPALSVLCSSGSNRPLGAVDTDNGNGELFMRAASLASAMGGAVDMSRSFIEVNLPLETRGYHGLGALQKKAIEDRKAQFIRYEWVFHREQFLSYRVVVRLTNLPPRMPSILKLQQQERLKPRSLSAREKVTFVVITEVRYSEFRKKATALSDWLGLGWQLPEVPEDSNEVPTEELPEPEPIPDRR